MLSLLQKIYNKAAFFRARLRALFWGLFAANIGREVYIKSGTLLFSPGKVEIGDYCTFGPMCTLNGHSGLIIGSFVRFGPNVCILSSLYRFDDWRVPQFFQGHEEGLVEIHDDVWIGVNAVVLPHVKVGRGAVVGANSVVTKNVAPYSIVAGAPASHIRYRFGEEERRKAMEVDIDYFKNPKHAAEAYNRSKDTPVK